MNLNYIIEFIEVLKSELKKTNDIDDILKIEKSYNNLHETFIEKIKNTSEFSKINKQSILEIFSSLDLTFRNAVVLQRLIININSKLQK